MIAGFSIVPLDKGESVGKFVADAVSVVIESGIKYKLTPMETVIEGDVDRIFDLIKKCHLKMRENSRRVITKITIDDREGTEDAINSKIKSVEKHLFKN